MKQCRKALFFVVGLIPIGSVYASCDSGSALGQGASVRKNNSNM